MFFDFQSLLKMCIFEWLSNQLNFSAAARISKIHVFEEAFFL